MKKAVLILFLLVFGFAGLAQHGPLVSQYMLNGLPLNPAFTGSRDALSVCTSYRNQWTGFQGAPVTQTISAHTPLKNEQFAVGMMAYGDRIGVSKVSGAMATFAYRLMLPQGRLSFGLSGGINHTRNNWSEVITNEQGDELFVGLNDQFTLPDFGVGMYFYSNKYYASLSIPSLLTPDYQGGSEYSAGHDISSYNWYLNGGYVATVSSELQLIPSVMVRYHRASSVQVDLNVIASYKDWIEAGLSFRTNDAVVTMLRVFATPQLSLGYSFDYTITELNKYSNGSHEVTIVYDFKYKTQASSPRFF